MSLHFQKLAVYLSQNKSQVIYYLLWSAIVLIGFKHFHSNFNDYEIYRTAGQRFLDGKALELYDVNRLEPGGFYYPYFWALVYGLFIKLTLGYDKLAFLFVFLGSYAYIVSYSLEWVLRKLNYDDSKKYSVASLLLLLNIYSFNDALINSNIGVLLMLFSVLSLKAEPRSSWRAGLYLALGSAFKLYPLLLVGYFGWKRNYKAIFYSILFFGLFYFAAPLMIEGVDSGIQILKNHSYVMSRYGDQIGWNYSVVVFQNISGFVLRYLSLFGVAEKSALYGVFGGILAALVVAYLPGYLKKDYLNKEIDFKISIQTLALVALVAPISWYNMGVFYVPLIGYHLARALYSNNALSKRVLGVYTIFYCLSGSDIWGREWNDKIEFFGIPFLGVVALLIGLRYRRAT